MKLLNSEDEATGLARLAAAALGGALLGARSTHRPTALVMRLAGLALIATAATPIANQGVRTAGARRRRLALRSSIEIERPITEVFAFFKDFENFPRILGMLRAVDDYQDGRSRWEVYSPSGEVIAWNAQVTKFLPNSVIAWESVHGSPVESSGLARFHPIAADRTRVDLELTYRPLRTGLNDAVWALVSTPVHAQLASALEHARFYLESRPRLSREQRSAADVA